MDKMKDGDCLVAKWQAMRTLQNEFLQWVDYVALIDDLELALRLIEERN